MSNVGEPFHRPSLHELLEHAPWRSLEEHLGDLRERVDASVQTAHRMRERYREELIESRPELLAAIARPSAEALEAAKALFLNGTVAASDGTISPVPLVAGAKIQVGVVIVSNTGDVVDLVTRVFEAELLSGVNTAAEF